MCDIKRYTDTRRWCIYGAEYLTIVECYELSKRRQRWFNSLCKPVFKDYCKTRNSDTFRKYQQLEFFISDILLHLKLKKKGVPHTFFKYSHSRISTGLYFHEN